MRSFISGSERWRRPGVRAAAALVAGCLAIAASTEGVVRLAFDRVSKIQRRTVTEYADVTSRYDGSHPTALFVGNSLLDEGIEFDAIRAQLAPEWDARRFVVEQTFYRDWYYGLRRLFHDGARPSVVVVVLTPLQWIRDDTRGDYSAQYLMTTRDAVAFAREMHMHPTMAASFVFASMSKFWGARAEIRNFVLGRVMPDLPALMNYSSVVDHAVLREADVAAVAEKRLERCRALAASYGAQLVALIPPILDPADGTAGLMLAGRDAGVTVLAPVLSGEYPASFYRDAGFHLNRTGAHQFTAALAAPLREAFNSLARESGHRVADVSRPLPSRH